MNNLNTAKKIAQLAAEKGGRAFFVGGYVRDKLLHQPSTDIDIEVHGLTPETLHDILCTIGDPLAFGQSFGIWTLRGTGLDIAMPRREHAIGRGHRDFAVSVDPFIGPEAAARRRDFTVNALMEDVLSGEVLDFFGGLDDLSKGILRHIDAETFLEDPLRVLRAAQFTARFSAVFPSPAFSNHISSSDASSPAPRSFTVAPETIELCKSIDQSPLSRERVFGELQKALLKSTHPSLFFETLRSMNQLDCWFPELKSLIGLVQDPIFHPEGDVWVHTMEVIDRAALLLQQYGRTEAAWGTDGDPKRSIASFSMPAIENPLGFMLLALTHDFGKIVATELVNGRYHAYGHEVQGLPLVEAFLRRLTNQSDLIHYVTNMVPLHMKPNVASQNKPSVKSTNHMFDEAVAPADLIYFGMADKPVVVNSNQPVGNHPAAKQPAAVATVEFHENYQFLFERLEIYRETMARPHVTGSDLIEAGMTPGPGFREALAFAHKLRLAGIGRESALKQTKAQFWKTKKKPLL